MKFHPDVLAAHAQFGGDLESMQKCYDWCDLTKEVSRLKIEASKHAHDAETVRRQRDQFMRENQSFTDAVVTLWEALSKACEIMSAYKRAGHGDEVHMDTLCCAIRTAEDALLQTAVQKQRCPAPNPRLLDAAKGMKRIVEEIDGTMNHGTWRDDRGNRLKDTPEWVEFYLALKEASDNG